MSNPLLKKLLILDLDETLIHASEKKLDIEADFFYNGYFVHKRPFLDEFITEVSTHFEVAIWSSADDLYVNEIVQALGVSCNFTVVWGNSRCTPKRDYTDDAIVYEKKLEKLKRKNFSIHQMIIVDDSPEKCRNNFGNAIYIKPFTGDQSDNELLYLKEYLFSIKEVENIRSLEKRGWRSKFNL